MKKTKPNFLLVWILGLMVCAMAQIPMWGIVLLSIGYGVLILLLRFRHSVLWLAYLIHGVRNQPEKALKLYDYAYAHGGRAGAPMIAYAMLLMERCRYDEALRVLQAVQGRSDLKPAMRFLSRRDLALACEKTGNVVQAIDEMEKIRQDYECLGSDFYATLAYFYIQAGEYGKAEEVNELSAAEEPGGAYYDNLALIAYRQGNLAKAEDLFQKALETDDTMLSPRYHLGLLAESRGEPDRAGEWFCAVHEAGVTGLSTVSPEAVEEKYRKYCS